MKHGIKIGSCKDRTVIFNNASLTPATQHFLCAETGKKTRKPAFQTFAELQKKIYSCTDYSPEEPRTIRLAIRIFV